MVTENIDIIVRERGARVVKRRLEDIGDVATRSVRGLRLLQNSLFVLGGAGAVAGLTRVLDTLTNFENRIRLVTRSSAELNAVQNELFEIATRTRGQFESTAEIYTRTALAVRELGISQRETLNFTESLNQAVILSGANVREANAALIQLAQGLASGRLNGDELRSVLEQLPFVADVIAKELGVTRGELRELGREGKLASDIILQAFRNAREEIAEKFANTIPTVGQSLQVLRTRALQALDAFDDFTGASELVARAIIAIADSLDFLVAGLLAAGTAFAAIKLAGFVTSVFQAIRASRELSTAVAAGNATLLTSVEVERAKAASSVVSAQASVANSAAKVREIQQGIVQLQQNRALLTQQQASIIIDKQRRIARDALTGRFIAYNAAVAQNIQTNRALLLTERALTTSKTQLAAATTAQTAATNVLSGAQTRSAAAGVAANTLTARLSRTFPLLSAAISVAARALSGLFALIIANPIGAIIAAITAAVTALVFFSGRIKVTEDGIVSLRDVFIATFQIIGELISPVTKFFAEQFNSAYEIVADGIRSVGQFFGSILSSILSAVKTMVNGLVGVYVGGYSAVVAVWGLLPNAFERIGALAINSMLKIVDSGIEGIVRGVGDLLEFLGRAFTAVGLDNPFAGLLDNFNVNLEKFRQDVPEAIGDIGQIAANEFLGAFERDYVGEAFNAILDRAREIAEQRLADLNDPSEKKTGTGTGKTGGSGTGSAIVPETEKTIQGGNKTFADIVRNLTLQNELLRVNASERERLNAILQIEDELKRSLTTTERELVQTLLRENEVLSRAAEIFEQINGPVQDYALTLEALNTLLQDGRINQDQFTESIRRARIEFLETQTDLTSGFERGFLKILERTADVAQQAEDIVTRVFDGMSSSIADLVVDGQADFSSLIRSINKQIVQLVVSQAFQQLFGDTGIKGGSGGNIFSGLFQGLRGLFGLQRGGSFMVGQNTGISPISNGGNDNRLVAFRAQDGEQVTVTPRGQSPQGASQQNVFNFNITTPDARSFQDSQSQIAAKAARIVGQGQRNM